MLPAPVSTVDWVAPPEDDVQVTVDCVTGQLASGAFATQVTSRCSGCPGTGPIVGAAGTVGMTLQRQGVR